MKRSWLMYGMIFALYASVSLQAANTVVVESKQVPANATNVKVGVYIENDVTLTAIVLPLAIREVTPGSFIKDALVIDTLNRLSSNLTGFVFFEYMPADDAPLGYCNGGEGFHTHGDPDFISPDGLMYVGIVTDGPPLAAGDDGIPPGGSPSLQLTFNVTNVSGTFEIDTTCVTPINHLMFYQYSTLQAYLPAFTKGVITICCACDCHTDPVCDGVYDVFDFLSIVAVAFQNGAPVVDPDPCCPYEDTDVDCNSVTDVFDVTKMGEVVFNNADPATEFCSPCGP